MPYVPFHDFVPDIGMHETRSITLFEPAGGLPADSYGFIEMFCDEAGCDCRRVFLMVVAESRSGPVAVVAWGWEDRAFYRQWFGRDDPERIDDLKGPVLNFGSPQSALAPAILDLVRIVLLEDEDYVERIKRHYALFRARIDGRSTLRRGSNVTPPSKARKHKRKGRR